MAWRKYKELTINRNSLLWTHILPWKLALTQSCVHMPGLGAEVAGCHIVVSRLRNVYGQRHVLLTDNSALGISRIITGRLHNCFASRDSSEAFCCKTCVWSAQCPPSYIKQLTGRWSRYFKVNRASTFRTYFFHFFLLCSLIAFLLKTPFNQKTGLNLFPAFSPQDLQNIATWCSTISMSTQTQLTLKWSGDCGNPVASGPKNRAAKDCLHRTCGRCGAAFVVTL